MRKAISATLSCLTATIVALAAHADTSLPQCDDVDVVDGVTLKFCSWQQDGIWHISPKVVNGAATKKEVAVKCPVGKTSNNVVIDTYEPGAERSVSESTLPQSTERPLPSCSFESVKDWVESKPRAEEQ